MSSLGTLSISIFMNDSQFSKSINNAKTSLETLGSNLSTLGADLSTKITLPLLAVGTAATKLSMDAIESENLFNVAMGGMQESARIWSEDLAKKLGLNAYGIRENVATLNAMTKSMGLNSTEAMNMSQGLTALSYDMASFFNLKPEEAFDKLRAGISGESEPLKQLGILINETTIKTYALQNGIIKQGETMTEAQKVQARYGAIMQATSLAQGDLARTMDSPTNKLRIMQEQVTQLGIQFGMLLIPILEKLMSTIQPLITTFNGLSTEKKQLVINIGLIVAAIPPLIFILGTLSTALSGLGTVLAFLTSPIGLVIVAIGALVAAFVYLWKTNSEFRTNILAVWNEIKPKIINILNGIKNAFIFTWNGILTFWNKYGETIKKGFAIVWEAIGKIFSSTLDVIQSTFKIFEGLFTGNWSLMWEGIKEVFIGIWNTLKLEADIIFKAIGALVGELVLAIWDKGLLPVYNWLKDTFIKVFEIVSNALTSAWNGLASIVGGIWNGISENVKSGINSVIEFINKFIKKINTVKISVPKVEIPLVGTVGGGTFGFNVPEIPKLARGGIVNSPTIAQIGEAGAEAVIPLENTSFVTKLADAIANSINNKGQNSGDVVLNIDGNRLARILNPYLNTQKIRISDI